MMTFPRYERYKESGIPWINEIPEHWQTQRGKWLFVKAERPVRADDDVVTAFRDGQVTLRINRRTEGFTNALQEHGYQGIRKGDLVINAMDAFAGAIGVSDSDGKATPVYSACVPRGEYEVNPHYYAYLLRHMSQCGYIQSLAKGIRERSTDFRYNDFGNLRFPIPEKHEQDRIVNFLDQKTIEIEAAIAKKQRLIELLKEQKAILINRAVTRGLNPNAAVRDSGVEWIGEIPAHWKIRRLKYLFKEIDIRTSSGEEELLSLRMYDGLVPHNDVSDKPITNEQLVGYKIVRPGQLVMNRMRASVGLFALAGANGLVSPDYAVFDVMADVDGAYYLNLFKTTAMGTIFWNESKGLGTGSAGFMRLYTDKFGLIKVPCPPMDEQRSIGRYFDGVKFEYAKVLSRIDEEIALLGELKSIVISQAVTGKLEA